MTPSQALRRQREAALARRASLQRALDALLEATADHPDDEHDPEGATIGFERAQVAALLAATDRHLADLDAAEGRDREGRYGRCETCGLPIAQARLLARPTARDCVDCASKER